MAGLSGSDHARTVSRLNILRLGAGRLNFPVLAGVQVPLYALLNVARLGATRLNYHSSKVFVSVDENRFRVQTSIPLREYVPQYGYYLNADVTVQVDGAQSLDHPQLSAIAVNGKRLPPDLLDWEYKSRRLKEYLSEYNETSETGSFEIRDGKVILRSRGR